jgi:hypothetical protein
MSKLDCQLSILHGLVYVSYRRDTIQNSLLLRVNIPSNVQEFKIKKDATTGLMTGHIG